MKKSIRWLFVLGMIAGLLASMLPAVGPVSAGTRAWSAVSLPSATSSRIKDVDITKVVVSPNFANDSTIFAIVDGDADGAADDVGRSTNGGLSWTILDPDTTSAGLDNNGDGDFTDATDLTAAVVQGSELVGIAVSNQYATDSTLVVVSSLAVFRSTNGGTTWGQLGARLGNSDRRTESDADASDLAITSVAIASNYDGIGVIAISMMDEDDADADYPTAAQSVQVWGVGGTLNWSVPTTGTGMVADVVRVAFSPAYGADATLLAVAASADGAPCTAAANTCLNTLVGTTNAWNATGGPTPLHDSLSFADATAQNASGSRLVSASFAFPSDFDSSNTARRKVFIGTTDDGASTLGSIYRATAMSSSAATALIAAAAGTDVSSTSIAGGNTDGGTLWIGLETNAVKRSVNAYASTGVTFTTSTTPPVPGAAVSGTATAGTASTITKTQVATASDGTVFAANSFDAQYAVTNSPFGTGIGSTAVNEQTGFSRSTDSGATFHQIALIDAAGSNTAAGNKITDIAVSGSTIFMVKVDSGALTDALWRSTNSGANWERVDTQDLSGSVEPGLIAMSPDYATDGLLYWADGAVAGGALRRTTNSGGSFITTSAPGLGSATISTIASLDTNTLLVGSSAATLRRSVNRGFIWVTVTASGIGTRVSSIARSPNYAADTTVLVGDASQAVFKSTNGGAAWSRVGSSNFFTASADINVAFDRNYGTNGILYAASGTSGDGVRRFVEGESTTSWTSINATAGTSYGSSTIATGYANRNLLSGGDGVLFGSLSLPGGGGVNRAHNATARSAAKIDFGSSPTFTHMANTSASAGLASTSFFGPMGWATGSDQLYAVDAGEALTANSVADSMRKFTDTWSNPQIVPSVVSPTGDAAVGTVPAPPAVQAVTIGTIPLSWTAVTGARGYQVNVSTSATFATTVALETVVVSGVTTTNATALSPNVRHYWRVRALLDPATSPGAAATADAWTRWSSGADSFIAGAGAVGVAIPGLTTPVLGVSGYADTDSQPTFVWTAVTAATNYEIQVSTDGTFAVAGSIVIDRTGANRLGNQLAYQDATSLQPGTTYFWRVRSYISGTAVTGAFSPASAFRTVAGAAVGGVAASTALSAVQGAGNLELVLGFNYVTGLYESYATDPSDSTTALGGNDLITIQPNSVIFVTVTQATTVVVSGVAYNITANTSTPLPVGAVTITLQ
jgi:hypothetical protein